MRLNEVIKQVDLSKIAIKFYEEKGLLKTKRDSNGYRNYTDKDISLLKEISSYRKMGIGLSDIKEILNDKSVLKQILIEKKKEITISQNELEALEKFIENNNIEELYDSVDYKTLADAIQNSIPGFYGYYFLNHFLPYLQIRIQTKEQQEAYNRLIEFWDNTNIKIPFLMKLNSWILFKLNSKKSLIVQIEQIDSKIKEMLNPTEEEYEKLKKKVNEGYKLKNSIFYKYSLIGISQRKFMKELQNKGYNDIFIPSMIALSPKYKEFYMPKNKPSIVEIPRMNYIAVRGTGNPNEENGDYQNTIGLLYGIAYTIKMSYKGTHKIDGFFEYVVPPLEGFWWQDGIKGTIDYNNKGAMHFISIIRLPDFVTKADFDWAVEEATKKKKKIFQELSS